MRLPGGWFYLSGRTSVTHYVLPGNSGASCGIYVIPASGWRGTGSQKEYDEVAKRPHCKNCSHHIGLTP